MNTKPFEIQLLEDNHFNVEKDPYWHGVVLNLSVQNPLIVQNTDQAFQETKITFRYLVRSALTTSVGPRLFFTSKKTGNVLKCTYYTIERPKSLNGNGETTARNTAELGFYHEVNESVTLSLAQLEIPKIDDEYEVTLFYGPSSPPVKLEIRLK